MKFVAFEFCEVIEIENEVSICYFKALDKGLGRALSKEYKKTLLNILNFHASIFLIDAFWIFLF